MTRPARASLFCAVFVFAAALLPRLLLSVFAPTAGGDWSNSYQPVALNLFLNGCISLSDPAAGLCIPSWGGNQAPGFSTFVAAVWQVFPRSQIAVLGVQSAIVAAAIVLVVLVVEEWTQSQRAGLIAGMVLAFSPQNMAWVRFASTDALMIAVSLVVIALLLRSLHQNRLSIWLLSLSMMVALAVRLDTFLFVVPIAVVALTIHGPRGTLQRGLAIGLILLVPAGLWTARNLSVGLPILPPEFFSPKIDLPHGYVRWGYGWTVREYQYPTWYYPAVFGEYDRIRIDPDVYVDDMERRQVEGLVSALRSHIGKSIPAPIDDQFEQLDRHRRLVMPIHYWAIYPAQRIVNMWFNPQNSTAWPVDVRPSAIARYEGETPLMRLLLLARDNPLAAVVKAGSAFYRLVLLGLAGWIFVLSCRQRQGGNWRYFVWAAMAYALGRTLFFAYFPLVETRYIMPVTPWLEVALALGLMVRFRPQWVARLTLLRPPCRDS